ncbi:MAG TPA: tetratricopeptide repeat protein, partial [Thermoanaerobaculia bacterium]|nr:tetratricopeptide repeat protein [Thermoanaerobaculia bacterium]
MNSRALPLLLLTLTFACATHTQSTPPPRSADFTAELLTGEVLDANQFAKRIASFGKQTRLTIDRDETRGDERIVETTAEYARDAFGDEGEPITRTTRVRQRETWVKTASGWNVRHVEELGEITPDVAFLRVLNREGVAKARAQFDAAHPPSDSVLNNAAYKLLGSGRVDDAIEVFRMENEAYPQTINAWDSLAEAYVAAKENEKAIELYRRVLAATPTDDRVLGIL